MKKIILISAIVFVSLFSFSGCYTYLTLYDGAKLADVPYEQYYPPIPPPPDPCCCPNPGPVVNYYPMPVDPPSPPYERPREISDIRNGGDGRNPDNSGRRR